MDKTKEISETKKIAAELLFEDVPSSEECIAVLDEIERRYGREINHKQNIAQLIIAFYKGREDLLEQEYARYGDRLKNYKVPPVILWDSDVVAIHDPKRNLVLLSWSEMEKIARDPVDKKKPAGLPSSTANIIEISPRIYFRKAGREEFDHSVHRFLHPGERVSSKGRRGSFEEYDSIPHEYHALGMNVLLGEKKGDPLDLVDSDRRRLKNALPLVKRDNESRK